MPLNNRNLFSNISGGWESKIKFPAGLVSSDAFLIGLQMSAFLLSLHMVVLPQRCPWCLCVPNIYLLEVHQADSLGPILMTWLTSTFLKRPYLQFLRCWGGLGLQYFTFDVGGGGSEIHPITLPKPFIVLDIAM